MKRILLTALLICFLGLSVQYSEAAPTKSAYNSQIQLAISKYKSKNYIGCIQDLTLVAKKDPSNVIAHYYIANAYMNLGQTDKALESFEKVIALNTTPSLTSYSIQAKNCLNTKSKCEYVKLTEDQVSELVKDPDNYLNNLREKKQAGITPDMQEIDRLIKGKYHSTVHPEANRIIIDTLLKQEKHDMNVSADKYKSEAPTNDEIANAVKVLAKAGINPIQQAPITAPYTNMPQNNDYGYLTMMMGNNQQNTNNNNYMNMLPYLVQQQNGNQQMNAEFIQTMMMSQMMPNFNFDTNKNY